MADVLIYSVLALGWAGAVIFWLRLRRIARELQQIADALVTTVRKFTRGAPDA